MQSVVDEGNELTTDINVKSTRFKIGDLDEDNSGVVVVIDNDGGGVSFQKQLVNIWDFAEGTFGGINNLGNSFGFSFDELTSNVSINQNDRQNGVYSFAIDEIDKTANFTADNYTRYTANGTLTVTDPTPIANKGFIVHVIGGSVTIGGVAYTSGDLVYRYYNGSSWISTNMNNAITIDATPTDGSSNAVSSNGVFDALALKADVYPNYPFNTSTNYFGLFDIVPVIVTNVVIGSSANNTSNAVNFNRFCVDKPITISDFAILQNAANDGASATVTLYVFDDSNGGLPGIKLHQEISANGILTPAQKWISFTDNLTLQKGNYWIALHFRGLNTSGTNPTFIGGLINHPNVATSIASYNTSFRVFATGAASDLVDNPTVTLGGSQNLPQIFIKI